VFTAADGCGLHPASASAWFKQLAREAVFDPLKRQALQAAAALMAGAAPWNEPERTEANELPSPAAEAAQEGCRRRKAVLSMAG